MRRDYAAHPYPERFDQWAKGDGECPYKKIERFWFFEERKDLWKPGKPEMEDRDLIVALCKQEGLGIKDHLKGKKSL
jgi:hypothetical protein